MENCQLKKCLSGVILVIFALISDNGVRTDVNFKSNPTTVKTFENDSVLLPCYSTGRENNKKTKRVFGKCSFFAFLLILRSFVPKSWAHLTCEWNDEAIFFSYLWWKI